MSHDAVSPPMGTLLLTLPGHIDAVMYQQSHLTLMPYTL